MSGSKKPRYPFELFSVLLAINQKSTYKLMIKLQFYLLLPVMFQVQISEINSMQERGFLRFHLIKPSIEFAFWVILLMCDPHFKSPEMVIPRYLLYYLVVQLIKKWDDLLLVPIFYHLLELKHIFHGLAQISCC